MLLCVDEEGTELMGEGVVAAELFGEWFGDVIGNKGRGRWS